jgi:hypothetical protein
MNTNQEKVKESVGSRLGHLQIIAAIGIPRKLGITEKAYCRMRGLARE